MIRLVAVVLFAFKAWMFVDAVKRKVDTYWFWVIPFVPLGAVAYFLKFKLRDPEVKYLKTRMLESLKRPPSVQELQEDFERSPSVANECRLAQGLYDAGEYVRAA